MLNAYLDAKAAPQPGFKNGHVEHQREKHLTCITLWTSTLTICSELSDLLIYQDTQKLHPIDLILFLSFSEWVAHL